MPHEKVAASSVRAQRKLASLRGKVKFTIDIAASRSNRKRKNLTGEVKKVSKQ